MNLPIGGKNLHQGTMKYNIKYTIEYILKLQIHQHSLLTRKVFSRHNLSAQVFFSVSYGSSSSHLCIQFIFIFKSSSLSIHLHHLHHLHCQVIFIKSGSSLDHHRVWIITWFGASLNHHQVWIITWSGASLDHHQVWIITWSRASLDHHQVWIITSSRSSSSLDHHFFWIVTGSSSSLDHHWIWIITGS